MGTAVGMENVVFSNSAYLHNYGGCRGFLPERIEVD